METRVFTELQQFTQWWVWAIIISLNILFIFLLLRKPGERPQAGQSVRNKRKLRFGLGICLLVAVTFLIIRLETRISTESVSVRFFPLQLSFQTWTWQEIDLARIKTYQPLQEYGGWGIRRGPGADHKAYTIAGDTGLQLELNDGKTLLIGTQKPGELARVLQEIGVLQE